MQSNDGQREADDTRKRTSEQSVEESEIPCTKCKKEAGERRSMEYVNSRQVAEKQFDGHCEVPRSNRPQKAVWRMKESAAKNRSEKGKEKECRLARQREATRS